MPKPTLHEGLQALRADRASEPAAVRALTRLASEFGTPLYVYDKATITGQFRAFRAAFAPRFPKLRIHYALKANTNGALVSLLRAEGAAAEVVSLGEILAALNAGYRGDEILFTSSSKGFEEIEKAVEIGALVNVDSRDELEQVAAHAEATGRTARISFRLGTLIALFTRRLTLEDAIRRVCERIGIQGRAIVWPYAEPCMDVDKPHQLELLRTDLAKQQRKSEARVRAAARRAGEAKPAKTTRKKTGEKKAAPTKAEKTNVKSATRAKLKA